MYREIESFVSDFISFRTSTSDSSPNFQMLDCTFGGGNHSSRLLTQHPSSLRVLGLDLDERVLSACRDRYKELIAAKRLALVHSNYVNAGFVDARAAFKRRLGLKDRHDIVLLDLGFSSY